MTSASTTRCRVPERRPDVPVAHGEGRGLVPGPVSQPRGLRLDRRPRFERDGQFLVLDLDELRGVFGDVRVLRQHHGHGLAHVAYPPTRQHGLQIVVEPVLGSGADRDRGDVLEIRAGENRLDAWHGQRRRRVDVPDPGVGHGGPDHPHPQLPDPVHVVHEVAEAAQQTPVFQAPDTAPHDAHCPWSPASRRGDGPSTLWSSEASSGTPPSTSGASPLPAAARTASVIPW